jgi:predicted small lipoprotein YifL
MKFPQMRRTLAPFMIAVMLLVTACGETKAPSRWDNAQQESTQKPSKTQQTNTQKNRRYSEITK